MCDSQENKELDFYDKMIIASSEFIGTAILVFMACLGATAGDSTLQRCLVSGIGVMTSIHIFGHISGSHVNPATTLRAYFMGQIDKMLIPIYFIAQMCGATLSFGFIKLMLPEKYSVNGSSNHGPGMTLPSIDGLTTFQVFSIEFAVSLILAFADCASWDSRTAHINDSVALRFGFLVTVLNCIAGPYTGCSMNPARSFGPAFWYNDWTIHWIYWVAPLTSGSLAAFLYKTLMRKKKPEKDIISLTYH